MRRKLISMMIFMSILSLGVTARTETTTGAYSIEVVDTAESTEYKCSYNEHHFLTLIDKNSAGIFRPHPGQDPNGWGSSWYSQPFLPGSTLSHAVINLVDPGTEGIDISLSGGVSRSESATYGTWSIVLTFTYDPQLKKVSGAGEYHITLSGPLDDNTGDLNLFKIASNYLDDVPLLGGGTGDTGDMECAEVVGDNLNFCWIPPDQPAHFPQNLTDDLSINVRGQYNDVDTAAQGFDPIEPAYKPSLKVVLISREPGIPMIFGGLYDTSYDPQYQLPRSQLFFSDNVGITPLILKNRSTGPEFHFDLRFESTTKELLPEGTVEEEADEEEGEGDKEEDIYNEAEQDVIGDEGIREIEDAEIEETPTPTPPLDPLGCVLSVLLRDRVSAASFFRQARDSFLNLEIGSKVVSAYYQVSPGVAKFLS